jgi:hypothetical protein
MCDLGLPCGKLAMLPIGKSPGLGVSIFESLPIRVGDRPTHLCKDFQAIRSALPAVLAAVFPCLIDECREFATFILTANDFHDAAVRRFKVCNRVGRVNDRWTEI